MEDPALFSERRLQLGGSFGPLDGCQLLLEYLALAERYPTPIRMVRGHAFKLLGESYLSWIEGFRIQDTADGLMSGCWKLALHIAFAL